MMFRILFIGLQRLLPSPKIVDSCSHCGTAVLAEAMASDVESVIILEDEKNAFISQTELYQLQVEDVSPRNSLTTSEKLQISLDRAKALAAMHGYEGGCMTLADTHIEEFLIAPDGTMKLNDFNLAEDPKWNEKRESTAFVI